jgi:hypothetical protein
VETLEVKLERGGTVLLPLMNLAIVAIDSAAGRITARESFIEDLID